MRSYHQIHQSVEMYPTHQVPITQPFTWLSEAWRDMHHHRGASYAHGALVTGFGALILAYSGHPLYIAASIVGFLLVGPLIAAGLCELSRRRDHGETTSFQSSLLGLRSNRRNLLAFAGVLLLLSIVWFSLCGLFLYAISGSVAPPLGDTVWGGVMNHVTSLQLEVYALAFTLLSVVVFAMSVVTVPMIIDRHVDALTAILMSLRVTWKDFPAMLVWAGLVVGLVLIGYATWLVGMIIVFPLLGHATWHAYRDIVGEA
jgi:uncharacterized membrane protein